MAITTHGLDPALETAVRDALADREGDVAVIAVAAPNGVLIHAADPRAWDAAMAGVRAAFFALQEAARTMTPGGGVITVIVPAQALRTSAGCGLSATAGAFMATVAQVAAVELAASGVRVNVIAAGPRIDDADPEVAAGVPLGRLARAADIAGACRLLASDDAGFVAGAVVAVDGGYAVTKTGGGSPFTV